MRTARGFRIVLVLMALFLVGMQPVRAYPASASESIGSSAYPGDKIDPALLKAINSSGKADFFIVLQEKAELSAASSIRAKAQRGSYVLNALVQTAESSQSSLRQFLTTAGFAFRPFYIANVILVRDGTEALVNQLAGRPDVVELSLDNAFQIDLPSVNPKASDSPMTVGGNIAFINADDVWELGITGEGIVLAANDTGLAWDHPAIINHYRGWDGVSADHNYNWWDPTGTYPLVPGDGFGHGTHVAGTMVGDDGSGNQIGVAPGAQTIHCKNLDDGGSGLDSWILECFEWDLAPWDLNGQNPDPGMAPDAVNNSWGYWGGGITIFTDAIANLQAAGILIEFSAGNAGPGCSTLGSPGDYGEVLTTGSVSWDGQEFPGSLSFFSSRGPSSLSSDFIPDVTAPGENVRSSVPGGGYDSWNGTSMSGPHVVGLVALMWSANPGLEGFIDATHQLILNTAAPLSGQPGSNCGGDYVEGPNFDWGYGTIDSLAAVDAALSFGGVGTLSGTVTDSSTTDPLANVQIAAALSDSFSWKTKTNTSGVYSRLVFSGTFTVTATLYGYYPGSAVDVSVVEDEITVQDFALDPAPFYMVSGTVVDSITGWPVYARIDITGYPYGPVFTDPETGEYAVELAAGIPYTFLVNSIFPGYIVQARGVGPLTEAQSEDFTLGVDALVCSAPGYLPAYSFFENFESGDGGFTVDGFGSWEWGTPKSGPGVARSGVNVWGTNLAGSYFDGEYAYIVSPEIDMSAFAGKEIVVDWWQWLITEEGFDYATMDVSRDGGNSWDTYFGPVSGIVDPGWSKHSVSLDSTYAVNNLMIRFGFQSDGSVTFPGMYIDDVGVGVVSAPPSLYEEDFEGGAGGFTISGTTSWEYGTPTKGPGSAHSGSQAWATDLDDNYGNNESGYLTSPVIDLTAGALALTGRGGGGGGMFITWWQWLQTESGYDFATVEVYDGSSWVALVNTSGPIDQGWTRYTFYLGPEYAISDFQIRFGLETDASVTYPGFYIDDLKIDQSTGVPPSVACNAQTGGLVAGYVTDRNTGAPLIGVRVSSESGTAFSIFSPGDPAVEDGFYTVFAETGPQLLTAEYAKYGPATRVPVVTLGEVVRQDFTMPAAQLSSSPDEVIVSVDMGSQTEVDIDLNNDGGFETNFTITEKAGDFQPLAPISVLVPGLESLDAPEDSYLSAAGGSTGNLPFLYTVPAGARLSSSTVNVLLLAAGDVTQIQSMLNAYPDMAVSFFDARTGTPSAGDLSAYDVVILISNNAFANPVAIGDALADYIDAGGAVIQTVPTFYDPGGNGWGVQGRYLDEGYGPFIGLGDWFSFAQLADFDPGHPIMEGVFYAEDFLRQIVELAPDSEWVANWSDDEFIATKGSNVALNTFIADGAAWGGDIPLIVHNSIIFAAVGQDVPWLMTEPVTGTIPSDSTAVITVKFDAGVPEITQPGSYAAALSVKNDSPYGNLVIPVVMNVNPPESWGRLSGYVESLGYCDAGGGPLAGAVIDIAGVAETGTGDSGEYVYWMEEGTYTVTVSAAGHISQEFEVEINPGQYTQVDLSLRLDSPCTSLEPGALLFNLPSNTQAQDTLTMDNTGAGSVSFTIFESALDLSSGEAPVGLRVPGPGFRDAAIGPASVVGLDGTPLFNGEIPLSGWFGALDHPEGVIRYAFAQCYEQSESFYVMGGVSGFDFNLSKKTWRYDSTSNSWTQLAPMFFAGEAPSATCYQGRIYVLGGGGSSDLQIYNIATDQWAIGASLPRGMEGAAVAAWNGQVFMIGGDDDFFPGSGVSDEVNIYDIASDTWIGNGADMPAAAGNAGFAQFGSYVYVVGGWGVNAPDANSQATQRYDLDNDTWEVGPDFFSGRADFALAATEGSLFALGGDEDGNFFFDATNQVEQLDLSGWPSGDWVDIGDPLPKKLSANQAGFCTQALLNPSTAEVWSVGGLDSNFFLIEGRALFRESAGESCYTIYTDVPWLTVGPTSGDVGAGESLEIDVQVDTTGLAPGMYTASIVVTSSDPGRPHQVIKVSLLVIGEEILFLPIIIR